MHFVQDVAPSATIVYTCPSPIIFAVRWTLASLHHCPATFFPAVHLTDACSLIYVNCNRFLIRSRAIQTPNRHKISDFYYSHNTFCTHSLTILPFGLVVRTLFFSLSLHFGQFDKLNSRVKINTKPTQINALVLYFPCLRELFGYANANYIFRFNEMLLR